MLIDTVSYRISDVRSFIRVSESGMSLILNKIIFKVVLFIEPLLIENSKDSNGQCKEYEMKNELLFMSGTEPAVHVLRVMSVVVNKQTSDYFSDNAQWSDYDKV